MFARLYYPRIRHPNCTYYARLHLSILVVVLVFSKALVPRILTFVFYPIICKLGYST